VDSYASVHFDGGVADGIGYFDVFLKVIIQEFENKIQGSFVVDHIKETFYGERKRLS